VTAVLGIFCFILGLVVALIDLFAFGCVSSALWNTSWMLFTGFILLFVFFFSIIRLIGMLPFGEVALYLAAMFATAHFGHYILWDLAIFALPILLLYSALNLLLGALKTYYEYKILKEAPQ